MLCRGWLHKRQPQRLCCVLEVTCPEDDEGGSCMPPATRFLWMHKVRSFLKEREYAQSTNDSAQHRPEEDHGAEDGRSQSAGSRVPYVGYNTASVHKLAGED